MRAKPLTVTETVRHLTKAEARTFAKDIEKARQELPREGLRDPWASWAEEAERRVSQIEKGEANFVSGEKVFKRIRAKYRK